MSIRQRAYPGEGVQTDVLTMHMGHARFVYNLGLEQRQYADRTARARGVKVNAATQSRELTDARRECDWLRAGSTVVQQGALRDLDRAFTAFFAGRSRFPRFRRRSKRQSFVVRDVRLRRYNRKWAAILVPKAGWVKFRLTRQWSDVLAATSARISLHNGVWHVSLTTPAPQRRAPGVGTVGLDRGVAITVATSDGAGFQAPTFTPGEQARFLALERLLATQPKRRNSRRREVTKGKLAVLRGRLGNRRTDFIEQTTTHLATTYQRAAIENLNVRSMVKRPAPKPDEHGGYSPNGAAAKSGLSRAIHASLWGTFAQRLTDKMDVHHVPAKYTSQRCHECGHTSPENRESQARFQCTMCGHTANADTNAAKNIRDLALHSVRTPSPGTQGDRAKPPTGNANLQRA